MAGLRAKIQNATRTIKQKDPAFASLESPFDTLQTTREAEKGTLQLRGLKGYIEPRIDYCSKAASFQPIRNGLITNPSWERQDFAVLLKMWCVDSPRGRHSRAAYAFNPDGTPTFEYEKALTVYAERRKDVVAAHSDEYVLKAGERTARNVLRPTTGPARIEGAQKQQSSSQIQQVVEENEEGEREDGEEEEKEDDEQQRRHGARSKPAFSRKQARGRARRLTRAKAQTKSMKTSLRRVSMQPQPQSAPNDGVAAQQPQCETLEERAESDQCYNDRYRERASFRRGLSPETQRTEAEAKRTKHEDSD
ncbi:hypothetical protein KCU65_g6637, partial [Aureobasidium melanogenum]